MSSEPMMTETPILKTYRGHRPDPQPDPAKPTIHRLIFHTESGHPLDVRISQVAFEQLKEALRWL